MVSFARENVHRVTMEEYVTTNTECAFVLRDLQELTAKLLVEVIASVFTATNSVHLLKVLQTQTKRVPCIFSASRTPTDVLVRPDSKARNVRNIVREDGMVLTANSHATAPLEAELVIE
ncbi:hypothetical protein X975_13016, partial [Stegodyphus mimosarum]